jgi:CheY-like chemotaxis protein
MSDAKKPRILMVDDIAENLDALARVLGGDYELRSAKSGKAALTAAKQTPLPDLILLDVMMPGMDGYEVIDKLKADTVTANIPVIFYTALDSQRDKLSGLALGAVDYISKTAGPDVLRATVRKHLK